MKKTINKVCNKKIKKIVEERYFPVSFIDRVNLMYYMNSQKNEMQNKSQTSANSDKSWFKTKLPVFWNTLQIRLVRFCHRLITLLVLKNNVFCPKFI